MALLSDTEHWFDSFSKYLALGNISRRQYLRLSILGGLLTRSGKRSGAQVSPLTTQPLRPGECVTSSTASETHIGYVVQSTFNGEPLQLAWDTTKQLNQLQRNPNRTLGGKMPSALAISLTLGGRQLAKIQVSNSGEVGQPNLQSIQTTFEYGEGFGIKSARVSVSNGQVQGNIDDRTFKPFPVSSHPRSLAELQFVDGKPAPKITIDPNLLNALNGLNRPAEQAVRSCKALGTPAPILGRGVPQRPVVTARGGEVRPAYLGSNQAQMCNACTGSCEKDFGICQGIDAGGTLGSCIFCPPCCPVAVGVGAAASGACDATLAGCLAACMVPGADCCPVFCFFSLNPGEGCCDSGETCVSQSDPVARGGCCANNQACGISCCPSGYACCGGANCCSPKQACSTEGVCCPPPQSNVTPVSCHGVCCAAGMVCRDVCCPPNAAVCNGKCCVGACDANGNCCQGHVCPGSNVCCPAFNLCCGSTCCDVNAQCVGGSCCPQTQVCGGICCPAGQACQDPRTQSCGACASGLVPCMPINSFTPMCCAAGASCCARQCCPSGQICCNVAGVYGCHTEQVCIP